MKHIREEVVSVADDVGIHLRVLTDDEAWKLLDEIGNRYCKKYSRQIPLWEQVRSCDAVHDPDGWAHIGEFFGDEQVIMLVEGKPPFGCIFDNSSDVKNLLSNSIAFEFCLTNTGKKSLVAFNDHDVLVMCGEAKGRAHFFNVSNV